MLIADRVGAKIAGRAALGVEGVVTSGGGLGTVLARPRTMGSTSYPAARVDMSETAPVVAVTIAVDWPCRVDEVCREVRTQVAGELARLTGVRPERVNVTVASIVTDDQNGGPTVGLVTLPTARSADGDDEHDSAATSEQAQPGHTGDPSPPRESRADEQEGPNAMAVAATTDIAEGKVFAPAAYPGAAILGSIIGLLLLGVAAIGIRDHIVRFGWIEGSPWTENAARWIAQSTWQAWMWPVAIGFIVVGLWMLWLAVKPRRTTHVPVGAYGVMWTRRGDVARRCSSAVSVIAGVEHATTVVGRRRARVTVTVSGDVDAAELHARATDAVAALKAPPRVRIRRVARAATPEAEVRT